VNKPDRGQRGRWEADPVDFIAKVLINPESGERFGLVRYTRSNSWSRKSRLQVRPPRQRHSTFCSITRPVAELLVS
jgi:hypothetical protein